ncbi:hypothetical protein JNUCC0626_22930 [Lentzea sp. JNUCC 0626]|uniref:hypothetical protein n=1 Tax=Lentzea sp. JNUCC 0626 TaxID=3367513 RepID=UPI0037483895
MEFRWRYQDAHGREVAGPDVTFAEQTEAEDWFSDQWRDLLKAGVEQVTLLQSEIEVYGPMSLHPSS